MTGHRPLGHNFKVGRTRIEDGWRLIGTCTCRTTINAENYGDLEALIADHYHDARIAQQRAAEEAAHT